MPYDNYLARLHKGEYIATAVEASEWRSGRRTRADEGVAGALCETIAEGNNLMREGNALLAAVGAEVKQQTTQLAGAFKDGSREIGRLQRNRDDANRVR